MSPYNESNFIKELLFLALGFAGSAVSIIYGMLGGKKFSIKHSVGMIAIGGFIGWACGTLLDSTLAAGIGGSLSLEIMHSLKEYGPEIIKEKFKNLLNKNENNK